MNALLSVVVITPDHYDTVARTMGHLHAQDGRERIEILLCIPSRAAVGPDRPEWNDFAAVRILETGNISVIAQAKALAVRAASAPIVAFAEEHAFPAAGWARALIARHEERHAVVGPVMVNPNPGLTIGWANFLIEYGPWMSPAEAGPRSHLPGNNSSYRRDLLLQFGDRLADMLDAETLLHWELAAAGHTLYLEPRAVTRHLNITRFSSFQRVHFQYGRMFAAQRGRHWNRFRRVLYSVGSLLIPMIRFVRHWPDIRRNPELPKRRLSFWWFLIFGLIESARGECAGYLTGAGDSRRHIFELEFHRSHHLHSTDRLPEFP